MSENAKPRKPRSSKPQISRSGDKVKVSLVLSSEVDFKLSVHAAALKMDRSALVNQVLGDALKRFVVQDRERSADLAAG
jgi:hypothetical protein